LINRLLRKMAERREEIRTWIAQTRLSSPGVVSLIVAVRKKSAVDKTRSTALQALLRFLLLSYLAVAVFMQAPPQQLVESAFEDAW
jgi:hypothetical protein